MVRTEKLINPFNESYLGVVKTSQTPESASEGLQVKPLILAMEVWFERKMEVISFEEFKERVLKELKFREWLTENEEYKKELAMLIRKTEEVNDYNELIQMLIEHLGSAYPAEDLTNIYRDLIAEERINDAKTLNRGVNCVYLNMPTYVLVCKLLPRYYIIDERVSNSYYSYVLKLFDAEAGKEVDAEIYGDLSYWGYANEQKTYDEALEQLLERNNLKKSEVAIYECGGYYQQNCEEVM
ncbi:MAG: hypothetical protein QXO22_04185 [Thermosphaera sp.]